jgi:hypothetical protein
MLPSPSSPFEKSTAIFGENMIRKSLTLFVAPVLFIAAIANAAPPNGPDGRRGPPPPPHTVLMAEADTLGLDDETVQRLEELVAEAGPEIIELRKALHEAQRDLMEQMMAELTPEQHEAAKELLPPPGRRGPPGMRGGSQMPSR